MLLFAILYFALMIDAGLFDPPVKWILKKLKVTPKNYIRDRFLTTLVSSLMAMAQPLT